MLILLVGLTIGTIAGDLLGNAFQQLAWLARAKFISWNPAGDFAIVKYNLSLQVKLNLASLIGLGFAYWISKKL